MFSRLDRMAEELRANPLKPQLAAAVTLYHVVVEASLAQPGQHMIEGYLEDLDVLPGFREGMRNVALDEQRHIGFGVKLLADLYREDPEPIQEAILDVLRETLPWTAAVAKPPNWDRRYTECFGFTLEDIGEAGATSLEQKLRAIGLPSTTSRASPCRWTSRRATALIRGQTMLRANLLGPDRPAVKDPEAVAFAFDGFRRQADATKVKPRHDPAVGVLGLRALARGARPGRLVGRPRPRGSPDVTLRTSFDDWADLVAGRAEPLRQILRRRLRVRGDWRAIAAMPRLMG